MATSELALIIKQLEQSFDKDPWYGKSINSILESVNPDFVFAPPAPDVHSIAELVAHIITWREFARQRLCGNDEYYTSQEDSFRWQRLNPNKSQAWEFLKKKLLTDYQNLLTLLRKHDDSILNQQVAEKDYSFGYMLNGIIQHDLYHLGQISLIAKIQKSRCLNKRKEQFKVFSYEDLSLSK